MGKPPGRQIAGAGAGGSAGGGVAQGVERLVGGDGAGRSVQAEATAVCGG